MANPEHVDIVKNGTKAIAEWRASHPDERLDLKETKQLRAVDLARADLSEADLSFAHLIETSLLGAKLSKASLNCAILFGANLSQADLDGADLKGADLQNANLSGANLRGADLGRAIFYRSILQQANLASVYLSATIFGDTDLSSVRGLNSIEHRGPSVIDERTLRESWPLPEVFLRGCGLSDQYIDYLPSLMGKAIDFYSCFISYSSKDQVFAERLHADLQSKGVRCWFAPEDLKIGERIRPGIDEAIRLHDKLLLILSEHSVNSQWVEQEVETALERERKQERTVLFPIRLDDAVMESKGGWAALIRNTRNIGDFQRWKEHDAYQLAFERLLRDLKAGSSTDGGTD